MVKTASEQEIKIGSPDQLSDAIDTHDALKKTMKKKGSYLLLGSNN